MRCSHLPQTYIGTARGGANLGDDFPAEPWELNPSFLRSSRALAQRVALLPVTTVSRSSRHTILWYQIGELDDLCGLRPTSKSTMRSSGTETSGTGFAKQRSDHRAWLARGARQITDAPHGMTIRKIRSDEIRTAHSQVANPLARQHIPRSADFSVCKARKSTASSRHSRNPTRCPR
jgi:hypothetical protein